MSEKQTRKFHPALLVFLVLPALMVGAAVLMLRGAATQDNAPAVALVDPQSPAIRGWQAEPFTLTTLDGDTVSLADYEGRLVFVNFWQTTCIPCIREFPAFEAFMAQQRGDDAPIVLAVNIEEQPDDIRAFLVELGVNGVPILLDETADVRADYGVVGLPTTFVIDQTGVVRSRNMGEITLDDLNTYAREFS